MSGCGWSEATSRSTSRLLLWRAVSSTLTWFSSVRCADNRLMVVSEMAPSSSSAQDHRKPPRRTRRSDPAVGRRLRKVKVRGRVREERAESLAQIQPARVDFREEGHAAAQSRGARPRSRPRAIARLVVADVSTSITCAAARSGDRRSTADERSWKSRRSHPRTCQQRMLQLCPDRVGRPGEILLAGQATRRWRATPTLATPPATGEPRWTAPSRVGDRPDVVDQP